MPEILYGSQVKQAVIVIEAAAFCRPGGVSGHSVISDCRVVKLRIRSEAVIGHLRGFHAIERVHAKPRVSRQYPDDEPPCLECQGIWTELNDTGGVLRLLRFVWHVRILLSYGAEDGSVTPVAEPHRTGQGNAFGEDHSEAVAVGGAHVHPVHREPVMGKLAAQQEGVHAGERYLPRR